MRSGMNCVHGREQGIGCPHCHGYSGQALPAPRVDAEHRAELDRLKGELAECEAALQLGRDGIQAYCDSENAMRAKLAEARRENERAQVQMAGVSVAALGSTKQPATRDQWGWSVAYQDTLELRRRYDAQQATIEQLGKDGAALATENERLKGELAEARGLLEERVIRETCIPCGRCITCRTLDFLSRIAPPPAESTPVCDCHKRKQMVCDVCQGVAGKELKDVQPAPSDDIRERLAEALENIERMKARYLEQSRELVAMEQERNDWRQKRVDIGIKLDLFAAGHKGQGCGRREGDAALEAKGEPGTHAFRCKDRHSKDMADCKTERFDCVCDCGAKRNEHAKGAKP